MVWKQNVKRRNNYYILVGLSLIFIVVSLAVGIWYYRKINLENVASTLKYNESIIALTQNRIDSELNEVRYIDYYIEIDDKVQKKLKGEVLSEQDKIDIRSMLYRLRESMRLLDDICIYFEDDDIVMSSRNITTPEIYFESQCKFMGYTYENWKNEYLLRPRNREFYPMQTIKLSDTFNQNIIVYKRTLLSSLSDDERVHILMTIRADGIERMINNIGDDVDSSAMIADQKGNIIYTTDKNETFLNTENIYYDNGRLISHEGDYVLYKKSDNLNLIYGIRMRKNYVLDNINSLVRIGIILIMLYLILVAAYLYLSVRLSYKPIKIIMDKIGNKDFVNDKSESEIDFITTKIDNMLEAENIYASKLEEMMQNRRNYTIRSLLLGNELRDENESIKWEHGQFAVSVVRIMSMDDFEDESEKQFVKYAVINMFKEVFHGFVQCEILEMNKNDIAVVFNFDELKYEILVEKIQESLGIISDITEIELNVSFTVAISEVCNDERKLAVCYREAIAATDFRSIDDEENVKIIRYDKINAAEPEQNTWYYWPSDIRNIFHEYVSKGDYKSIDSSVDEIVNTNIKTPKDIVSLGECLYYNIFGVLIDISSEYISAYSMMEDLSKYNKERHFKENIDALKDRFKTLCDIAASRNTGDTELLHRIEKYIDEHFTESNLDLAKISDNVQISVRYLTSYFKKHKNTTILKYITHKRIEYAKKLIADTQDTIATIAIRVGYTDSRVFAKLFKRNEGMTPGQYREIQ